MFKAGLRVMTKRALVNFINHSMSELRARIEKFHIMSHFLRFADFCIYFITISRNFWVMKWEISTVNVTNNILHRIVSVYFGMS